jgi:hypothetical protein
VAFPIVCSLALRRGSKHTYIQYIRAPLRDWELQSLWAGPILFGRKLLLVVVVSAVGSADYLQTLPMLVEGTLLLFVLIQVCAHALAVCTCGSS